MPYSIAELVPICTSLKQEKRRVVLATGFFDLLHQEHINFLKKAKAAGDVLIVAVESDERARKIKGLGRPHDPQSVRCKNVAKFADYVIALPDDFDNQAAYENLMATISPDIYAVSSHTGHRENKRLVTEKYGGILRVVHQWNPAISTSIRIKQNQV